MPSVMTFERQKMSVEMWEKLKSHIMKQREKRKQEQEQDAEQERHRREQELKRKRDATTLEDIKDQLSKLEARLKELKEEKHELFLQLKKVLNEDEIRKRQKESEIMAAHQALQAQQQINLQNALNFYSNSSLYQKPQTQAPQQLQQPAPHLVPTSQPMSAVQISQSSVVNAAQQLYAKLSPMPVSVSLASSINNSVITQSAAMSGQAQLNPSKRACSKRVHERSPSPQPAIPYTGILPIYKTTLAFTPTLARNPSVSQPLYYPPPTSQIGSTQMNAAGSLGFDAKSNPFQFLQSGLPPGTSVEALQEQSNQLAAVSNAAINQQQLNQLQQELYHQQLRGMPGLHPGASMIPIQNAAAAQQLKQGSISGGFPMQRAGVNVSQASVNGAVNAPPTQARNFQQRFLY